MKFLRKVFLCALGLSSQLPFAFTNTIEDIEFINEACLNTNLTTSKLAFEDPGLANLVLKELDVFEPNYNNWPEEKWDRKYKGYYLGLAPDDDYCDKHREYFTQNPDYVFSESNYVSSYLPQHFARKFALDQIGTNVQPDVQYLKKRNPKRSRPDVDLAIDSSLIVTGSTMFYKRHVGKQFSCLGQMSNHIPGHDSLYQKDQAAIGLIEYAKKYEDRPQCLRSDRFFPKNYLLTDKEQCLEFFQVLESEKYQELKEERNIVFMRKIVGMHGGFGVFPVDSKEEQVIRKMYANGERCGEEKQNNIVQAFIHNPLLLNGRKSDVRLYMLVASTNPLIVYYHDGYFRVSLTDYDMNTEDQSALITNTAFSSVLAEAEKTGSYQGKTYDEWKDEQTWLFDKFQNHIIEKGLTADENWMDNHFRPECKKAMIHLLRMSQHNFLKRSSLFEFYAIDFMLDEDLNLWFIEANALPGLAEWTPDFTKFDGQMLRDEFDIIFRLLRSRMKRVFNFVNDLINEGGAKRIAEDKVEIDNLAENIEAFKKISMNYFEPEYEPTDDNSWHKIIDENHQGVERYAGLISEECL